MKMNEPLSLKYGNEHLTCRNYLKEADHGFIYREYKKEGNKLMISLANSHCLNILLEGRIRVSCDRWLNREVMKGEMFLIARSSHMRTECLSDCRLLTLMFSAPTTNCDKLNFHELAALSNEVNYELNTLPVRPPVDLFLELLVCYLSAQANCYHLHEMKQNELFLCLRYFYTKQELASLFYPILTRSQDFRSFVLENYPKVKSVKQLIALSNMSRSVFYNKFTEEFGVPAKQWLTEKLLQRIAYSACEPGMSVKKLMSQFQFESLSQFQIYCKRNLGCTPTELISRSLNGNIDFQKMGAT